MHTKQETFDHIVHALISQGRQSTDKYGDCQYRGEDGAKCAAGWCITDNQYRKHWEGKMVKEDECIARAITENGWDSEIVVALQIAHDKFVVIGSWLEHFKAGARDVAVTYQLDDEVCR